MHIAPKPTTYRGVKFKSRMEARYAVFLDHCKSVKDWNYEPDTFLLEPNNWKYTADFFVESSGPMKDFYMECKPKELSKEAYAQLQATASLIHSKYAPLILVIGDFYAATPFIDDFRRKPHSLEYCVYFPNCYNAINIAKRYRFDLKG